MYDADEGYSIDEYWLSYFKDIDLALEKLNLILDTFRKLHQEGARTAHDPDIDDSTRRAVADIGDPADQHKDYKKDKKENKANRRSLTEKMSAMLLNNNDSENTLAPPQNEKSDLDLEKTPTQGSTLASKLKHFASNSNASDTPPSGSVATLRPSTDSRDSATPPPVGTVPSSDSLPTSAQGHTYPPEPSSSATSVSEPPRRTSTLGKIFSASSSGSRKILEVVTHSNLPGRRNTKGKTATEQRPDPNKTVLDETVVEEPEDIKEDDGSSKTTTQFRKMFGLSDKEELHERTYLSHYSSQRSQADNPILFTEYPAYLYRGLPISGRVYISTNYFCFRSSGILAVKTKVSFAEKPDS